MSWDCDIVDKKGKIFKNVNNLPLIGGTYMLNGVQDLTFNITYNYSKIIREANMENKSLSEWLDGRKVSETLSGLTASLQYLRQIIAKEPPDSKLVIETDYWAETPRNVYKALSTLVQMSISSPDVLENGIWRIV